MRRAYLLLLVAALLGTIPADAEEKTPTGVRAVELAALKSTYHLYAPEGYTPTVRWPLVVALHPARTRAESNLRWWHPEAKKRGWFVLCPKSRGDRWVESDGDVVLAALADLRKTYNIDEHKTCIAGYSSGAGMATGWGVKNHHLWCCLFAHAGVAFPADVEGAAPQLHVLLSSGDKDTATTRVRASYEALKKLDFDIEFVEHKNMGHFDTRPEVWSQAYDFFESRIALPGECLRRAIQARAQKRWADAVAEIRSVLTLTEQKKPLKAIRRRATKEKAALEREGEKQVRAASARARTEPDAATRELNALATLYAGWKPAKKAKVALERLAKR